MAVYTIDSKPDYPGPKEIAIGSPMQFGVYIESLIPHTDLRQYKLREMRKLGLDNGWVMDCLATFTESGAILVPEITSQAGIIAHAINSTSCNNPGINPSSGSEVSKSLTVPASYMRKNNGLKVLFPFKDSEFVCRIHPPRAVRPVYVGPPSILR